MAMKKAKPKSSIPKPPSPASKAGKTAAAKMSKETSAKTRGRAKIKNGQGYLKSSSKSMAGDLGGPNSGQLKGFDFGRAKFNRSRTEQRKLKEDKRSGAYYLRDAKSGLTFESPYFLSKYNDLGGVGTPERRGRTAQRGIDQAKQNPKKKNVKRGARNT